MTGNFQNEYHHLRANLLAIAAWLRQEVNRILEPFDVTQQQLNALRILRGQLNVQRTTSFSTNDLREHLLDKSADTSRLVDRLYEKGLVEKSLCPQDSRRLNLSLSEAGLALLAQIDTRMSELDALLNAVSPEEAAQMNAWLDKLTLEQI